nr:putative reverse transcriptase domain-containing protein [Tanacetum cinerariifolium]
SVVRQLCRLRLGKKRYADKRRKPLEFSVGDYVLLKVSPWKGVVRFGKKGKLKPRFFGPFEIIEKVGPMAYRLDFPKELNGVMTRAARKSLACIRLCPRGQSCLHALSNGCGTDVCDIRTSYVSHQCTSFVGYNVAPCLLRGLATHFLLRRLAAPCLLTGLDTPFLPRRLAAPCLLRGLAANFLLRRLAAHCLLKGLATS